ncbi:MAG: Eco57I restriction-modification methylase domain-containing protein [Neisseriaceae bacterium]|nr:Eco57I restriction-modification methylase domain-containing protein [Neisseriaceae bacterium]
MANGGFDIVIGNPPYVDSESMTKYLFKQREFIAKNYNYAKGNWDLLIPFIEKGCNLININGLVCFITSNKWLALDYGNSIREFVVPHIDLIIDCTDEKVFDSASISSVIFCIRKKYTKTILVGRAKNAQINIDKTIDNNIELLENNLSIVFSDGISLIHKLSQFSKLGDDKKISVFGSFTTAEAYDLTQFIIDKQIVSKDDFKLINTGLIDKYTSLWGYQDIKYLKKSLQYPVVNREIFRQNFERRYNKLSTQKIIITGIRYFEALLDKDNLYLPAKSTVTITGDLTKLYCLVCLLNSKIISYYIHENYYSSSMGGGINFTPDLIKSLPVPDNLDSEICRNFADKMLSLNAELNDKKSRFIRRLQQNFAHIKIKGGLTQFWQLSFADFVNELKKQKIKLTLAEQDEWEDYFTQYQTHLTALQQTISQTDKTIDQMVYQLYGLTDEEIKIVEQA